MNLPKVTIGIISYNDKKYLEKNLKTFKNLDYPDFEIFVFDNNPDNQTKEWIKKNFPDIKVFKEDQNLGFGVSHNKLIDKASGQFYLAFNSDMFPKKDFLKQLVLEIIKDKKIAVVTGKLLQWRNFPDHPADQAKQYLDTTGLVISQKHRVFDRGQTHLDTGQYDQIEEIWGASGAAPLFRIQALKDIAHQPGEYFDQDFFIYKEDIDLSYRLRWAGWKTFYNPQAIAWHDRTTSEMGNIVQTIRKRKERSRIVKEKSFLNQLLFVYKNWSDKYSSKTKIKTKLFHAQYITYALLFEPFLLKQLRVFRKMKPLILEKRKKMPRRITAKQMEKWFQ